MCSTKELYHSEVSDQSQMNGRTASTAWLSEAAELSSLIIYDMELKHHNIQKRRRDKIDKKLFKPTKATVVWFHLCIIHGSFGYRLAVQVHGLIFVQSLEAESKSWHGKLKQKRNFQDWMCIFYYGLWTNTILFLSGSSLTLHPFLERDCVRLWFKTKTYWILPQFLKVEDLLNTKFLV